MQTPSMAASNTLYYPTPKSFLLSSPSRNSKNLISCSTKPICSPLQTTNHRSQKQTLLQILYYVYGNRNGFLTVLTEPLSRAEERFIVRQVRRLELALLKRWLRKCLKPVDHSFVSDVTQFVKDPSDL